MKLGVTVGSAGATAPIWHDLTRLVSRVTDLEFSLLFRLLQARTNAAEVGRYDDEIKPLLTLFAAGTSILVDCAADLADTTGADFDGGADPLVFLRERGLITPETATIDGVMTAAKSIVIGEDFLVARRVPLGPLLDLTARLLDALDANYGLFKDEPVVVERVVNDTQSAAHSANQG